MAAVVVVTVAIVATAVLKGFQAIQEADLVADQRVMITLTYRLVVATDRVWLVLVRTE